MRYRRLSRRYTLFAPGEDLLHTAMLRLASIGPLMRPPYWRPPADVYETASAIIVTVELAGVDPDALEVLLYEDALVIAGQRKAGSHAEGVYHTAELSWGPFLLDVRLPAPIDAERVEARYDAGLLRVELPRQTGA